MSRLTGIRRKIVAKVKSEGFPRAFARCVVSNPKKVILNIHLYEKEDIRK